MTKPLTAAAVERYKPAGKRRFIKDSAPGLYLVVQTSGHKSFLMRFRSRSGKISKIVLGPVHDGDEPAGAPVIGAPLTLAGARQLAAEVIRQRQLGADVVGDHKARKRRARAEAVDRRDNTFGAAARDYVEEHARPETRNWRSTAKMLGLSYPRDGGRASVIRGGLAERWADKPVREMDGHLVFGMVDEARRISVPGIEAHNRGVSDARARMLFVALSSMFSWLQRQRRVEVNPCKSVARPKQADARDRVLNNDEIELFWRACDEVGEPFGAIFKLLLLTGARLNEVAGMTAAELRDDDSWHLPGSRTKNKKAHVVPLPPLAREIIEAVPRIEGQAGYLFTTTGETPVSGWSRAKRRLDALMLKIAREKRGRGAEVEAWRLHDLRRSFVTGCAELGVPPHVIELAVNHVSGTRAGIAGVYNKSKMLPERRTALERWSAHVLGLVSGKPAKVVSIRGRGSR